MKKELLKIIAHFSERKTINNKKTFSIFFICFSISLFIWFLTKLSQNYTTTINFQIKYINSLPKKALTHTYDSVISIEMTSNGLNLLNFRFFKHKKSLKINLLESDIKNKSYSIENYILTKDILQQIYYQLDFSEKISKISPDTLIFILENIISKNVEVIGDFEIQCKTQYQIYGSSRISPSTITISGPPSMIDSIHSIKTFSKLFMSVDKNINVQLELKKPINDNKITLSTDTVGLYVPIEKFTENIVESPIVVRNNENSVIKLFPENVKVTYQIALKDYSNFRTDMLSVGINFDNNENRQSVRIFHQPSFIKITNIAPETIEYIILK